MLRLLSLIAFVMILVNSAATAAEVDWAAPDWTQIRLSGVYVGQPAAAAVAALRATYGAGNVQVGRLGCIADVRAALVAKKTSAVPRCFIGALGKSQEKSTIVSFIEIVPTRTSVVVNVIYSVSGFRTQADSDAFRAAVYQRYGPPTDANAQSASWCSTSDVDTKSIGRPICRPGNYLSTRAQFGDTSGVAPMQYGSCDPVLANNGIDARYRYVQLSIGSGGALIQVADPVTYLTNCSRYNALYNATSTQKPDF